MSRSLKKGYYINPKLLRKIVAMNASGEKKIIKVRDRSCTIVPEMVGLTFSVHTGKTFQTVYVSEDMLGHKLGEFALTRTFRGHPF
ncbi:MAG: 30S ribosomal protein S19 [Candidatus Absconditabacterales bacterium]|nr:30S ribosomal protein S19 [Candidatus Absconditabacterales bacterium]